MMTAIGINFKPLTRNDAPLLSEVALHSYRQHYLHLWYDGGDWYMNRSFAVDALRVELADPNSAWFLVQVNDQPAGFIKLNIDKALADDAPKTTLELERIYLIQEVTGQGVGKAAIEFVVAYAHQLGKNLIWLKAMDSSTDALAFYRKMGFSPCGNHFLDTELIKVEYRGMVVLKKVL